MKAYTKKKRYLLKSLNAHKEFYRTDLSVGFYNHFRFAPSTKMKIVEWGGGGDEVGTLNDYLRAW